MSTEPSPSFRDSDDPVAAAASRWLARRDRGLTAAEQDDYLQWLRENPEHGRTVARLEKTWGALDTLAEWRPNHSDRPNPDLLARPAHRRWPYAASLAAALIVVAGVVTFGVLARRPTAQPEAPRVAAAPVANHGVRVLPRAERVVLEDGSVVELNREGRIEAAFSAAERRVRLLAGEAHFTVAKNPARPFVVDAGAVMVRAVGTAFDVRRATASVEVLVTEGKVHLERPAQGGAAPAPTPVVAGERAVVDTASAGAPTVVTVAGADVDRALAWRELRLEFSEVSLGDAVAEFNLRNRSQVIIADVETARLRVAGSFRADNVDAFVRLLEQSFGVAVERRDDGTTILRRAK